jgi:hypothetical protein
MFYHSENGQEFLGLRAMRNGRHQVVYDATTGERVVVTIKDPSTSASLIDAALQEGIRANKVLAGVLSALKVRNIKFDLSV